jgi:hypothetical protein
MALLRCKAQVVAHFSYFEIALNLTQYRYMVCAECTIGSEIILNALDGTPRLRGSDGSSFLSVLR